MAQLQVMGPPLSPRETRRSGRRSGPSESKSPESDIPPPLPRPPLLSSNSGGSNNGNRNKRLKQEDLDDLGDDRKTVPVQSTSTSSNSSTQGSTKPKRKPKEKHQPPEQSLDPPEMIVPEAPAQEEEEEQGITRCICGSTGEDDPDAGEFMVQCETCQVWQHGLCMGFESEDQLHEGDYYCEQCRPDMHVELLKRLARRPRHSSTTSHHTAGANSRLSRSHSPHLAKQQASKRRNTMNSRDAAFDENLKEILETTAAEAGAVPESVILHPNAQTTGAHEGDEPMEQAATNRNKKRKRADNDISTTKKRTRSMSLTSEHPPTANAPDEALSLPPPPPPASKSGGRKQRGGRKSAVVHDPADSIDGLQPPPSAKRSSSHRKGGKGNARPPQSSAGIVGPVGPHDSNSRRAQGNSSSAAAQNPSDWRTHRTSHAYVVSQQPLYTSWNLPDYLSHLEEMLPTEVPRPLEVVAGATGRESVERTTERGVKVKWPSKRTSVADMNKRVRALVEWVGREQASASDRARRRDALEKALKERSGQGAMLLDRGLTESPPSMSQNAPDAVKHGDASTSMKDMEMLMEELIGFQERFGPGARRERRAAAVNS